MGPAALLEEHKKLLAEARTQAHGLLVEARTSAEKERALAMERTLQEQQQLLDRARRAIGEERIQDDSRPFLIAVEAGDVSRSDEDRI